MKLFLVIVMMSVVLANPADANEPATASCFGPLAPILSAGGYSGSLDCDAVHVEIKKIGTVIVTTDQYAIYDLRYKTVPVPGGVPHGGQRLLIVLNGAKYLGQYALDTPPFHNISVKGASIFVDVSPEDGNEIKMGKNGPPADVFLDQDTRNFFK